MPGDTDFVAVARKVIARNRIGHRLMVAYYVVAAVVVISSCALQPSYAGIFIGAAFVIGILLLIDVSIANGRALGPLQAAWPDLAKLPDPGVHGGTRRKGRQSSPAQPHSGSGGAFYVILLLVLAAAGGIAFAVANAVAAPVTTPVTVSSCDYSEHYREDLCTAYWQADGHWYRGTITWASGPGTEEGRYNTQQPGVIDAGSALNVSWITVGFLGLIMLIAVPIAAWQYPKYERETRRPFLARLEHAVADGGPAPPAPLSYEESLHARARQEIPGRHKHRIGEIVWMVFLGTLVASRGVLVLVAIVHGAAASGSGKNGPVAPGTRVAGPPAASAPTTPAAYPTPAVASGVVTDGAAGIRYPAPPGLGWSQDTSPAYPPQGAEFIKQVPGQPGDAANVVSSPLPAGIAFEGANGLRDAAAAFLGRISGTEYSAHTSTVLENHGFRVCGQAGWLAEFRIHYTAEHLPDETGAIAVISLRGGRRPGVLFASVPDVMSSKLAGQIAQSARPATGCPG